MLSSNRWLFWLLAPVVLTLLGCSSTGGRSGTIQYETACGSISKFASGETIARGTWLPNSCDWVESCCPTITKQDAESSRGRICAARSNACGGMFKAAMTIYKDLLRQQPRERDANRFMGKLLLQQTANLDAACDHLKIALEERPSPMLYIEHADCEYQRVESLTGTSSAATSATEWATACAALARAVERGGIYHPSATETRLRLEKLHGQGLCLEVSAAEK